ncbi:hypothetical protein AXF42_Ash001945 [Apostasia shenzhenica]|uniref:Uncharacterized protein n=1 Tax=Apostasia shenzhenica TaxID=1088818 RepID=A0A2I0ABN3_9ASPA|nr:hypothetical protein AXF42_Ash001945 [Apostasia shenzhenica]
MRVKRSVFLFLDASASPLSCGELFNGICSWWSVWLHPGFPEKRRWTSSGFALLVGHRRGLEP